MFQDAAGSSREGGLRWVANKTTQEAQYIVGCQQNDTRGAVLGHVGVANKTTQEVQHWAIWILRALAPCEQYWRRCTESRRAGARNSYCELRTLRRARPQSYSFSRSPDRAPISYARAPKPLWAA